MGRALGYDDVSSYAAFGALAALTIAAARRVQRWWRLPRPWPDSLMATAVLAVAIVVAVTMMAGASGRLTLAVVLTLHAAGFAVSLAAPRQPASPRATEEAVAWPVLPVAVAASASAFLLAFAVWHAPLTLYDSVSYHLFFAGRWVQDHALTIIPTPFSDEAQAYAPANGELYLAWLMLPLHGDALAKMGQWPFAALGMAAVYGLARRGGAEPAHAIYPAVFFLLSRPIAEQAVGANVDLVCAALFSAALYFTVTALESDSRGDWLLAGVAAGLYAGSKYLALVYLPALLIVILARGIRRRALWMAPGVCAFALPWYLRNWIVTGSPIYPSSLTVAGVTIARGAFTRAAMLNTVFHTSDPRLLPPILAHAFGPALFVIWLPFAVAGAIAMARRGWWPAGALSVVPLVMLPLFWFGLPVNVESRFLNAGHRPGAAADGIRLHGGSPLEPRGSDDVRRNDGVAARRGARVAAGEAPLVHARVAIARRASSAGVPGVVRRDRPCDLRDMVAESEST